MEKIIDMKRVSAPHHGNKLRSQSASHCPESPGLRGFFVYTSGSVLLAETHTPSPDRNTKKHDSLQHALPRFSGSFPAARGAESTRLFVHLFHILRAAECEDIRSQIPFPAERNCSCPGCCINRAITSCSAGKWDFVRLFSSDLECEVGSFEWRTERQAGGA